MDAASFRNFMFQGKALFTIKNRESEDPNSEVTLLIKSLPKRRNDPENREVFNVELKSVDGVYQRSIFIGTINRTLKQFNKVRWIDAINPGVMNIEWIVQNWSNLEDFPDTSFNHRGHCCKCGISLTLPESMENGIGPICIKTREKQTFNIEYLMLKGS